MSDVIEQSPFPGAPLYDLNHRAEWLRKRQGCILPGTVAGYRALLRLLGVFPRIEGAGGVTTGTAPHHSARGDFSERAGSRKPRCSLRGVGDSLYEEAVPKGTASLFPCRLSVRTGSDDRCSAQNPETLGAFRKSIEPTHQPNAITITRYHHWLEAHVVCELTIVHTSGSDM